MRYVVALAVGYAVGARAGSKNLDQVTDALRRIRASEEFEDLSLAVRSHVGDTLRELASMVERRSQPFPSSVDLVDEVHGLFGQR